MNLALGHLPASFVSYTEQGIGVLMRHQFNIPRVSQNLGHCPPNKLLSTADQQLVADVGSPRWVLK